MSFLKSAVLALSLILWPAFVFSSTQPNCANIEELKVKYFAQNQYNEFVEELDNFQNKNELLQPCLDYYKALTRYTQLKYLEEKQSWDDYFANGNTYRAELEENTKKVINQVDSHNPLKLKSIFLLWQFHRGQQDAFSAQSLTDLMEELKLYAKQDNDQQLIKDIADKLSADEEKLDARLAYKLYVDKLLANKLTDAQLKNAAAGFYKDGNLELAQSVYDIYIENISKSFTPEKLAPELFELASLFVYKEQGFSDPAYAEKIYAKIEELGGRAVFNQETIYLRAFNLEKLTGYGKAEELYLQLIQLYPDTKHYDEAAYKIAMINAYALADLTKAEKYFELLTSKTVFSPQVISSFYQLGLFAQWKDDLAGAKDYYNLLLKTAADNYPSITAQAQDRLKEIEENKPLNYNLKTFLGLSLKMGNALVEAGKLDLKASGYILEKGQKFTVSSSTDMPQSGCNSVQLQYLWSGDLDGAVAGVDSADFQGAYPDAGTKAVNIVIISPAQTIDRAFIMIDVY